jgi:hypothetical protein
MKLLTPARAALMVAWLLSLPATGIGQTAEAWPPVDAFLEMWLLKQDPVGARQQFVSVPHILNNTPELRSAEEATDWIQRVMTMWLFADHGIVTQLGHGDPASGVWRRLPTTPASIDAERNRFETVKSAITSPGSADRPYDLTAVDVDPLKSNLVGKRAYVVTFKFRQVPRDTLCSSSARSVFCRQLPAFSEALARRRASLPAGEVRQRRPHSGGSFNSVGRALEGAQVLPSSSDRVRVFHPSQDLL